MEHLIEEQLSSMGYSAPNWDNFQINKPPPSSVASPYISPIYATRKQRLVHTAWPKIEGFYQEDEDPIVISLAETIKKNGLITRVFRLYFDNENGRQRWEFVLEKQLLESCTSGSAILNQDIRQLWAKTDASFLNEIDETATYTRSFDTQAQSTKFKINRDDGATQSSQRGFLREIKGFITDAFQSSEPFIFTDTDEGQDNSEKIKGVFFRGKSFEFQENGHQVGWTVSVRRLKKTEAPVNSWYVDVTDTNNTNSKDAVQGLQNEKKQLNPFTTETDGPNPFLATEGFPGSNSLENTDAERRAVEQNILEFINFVWPKVRNFYLGFEDISYEVTTVRQNGEPTKILELHFDTLNERNRWRILFEVGISAGAESKIPSADLASLDAGNSSSYSETRTYGSYEKRGTHAKQGQDQSNYFTGFHKRWFLSEVQWKLVKCFAQVGHFSLNAATFDKSFFEFGKDVEFTEQDAQVTWSVSVQKAFKYPLIEAPNKVWCYGLTDKFLQSTVDIEGVKEPTDAKLGDPKQAPTSGIPVQAGEDVNIKTGASKTKSKSRIRNFAKTIVRPVMRKPSWLGGGSGSNRVSRQAKKEVKNLDPEKGLNDEDLEEVKVASTSDEHEQEEEHSATVNNPDEATNEETAEYF